MNLRKEVHEDANFPEILQFGSKSQFSMKISSHFFQKVTILSCKVHEIIEFKIAQFVKKKSCTILDFPDI